MATREGPWEAGAHVPYMIFLLWKNVFFFQKRVFISFRRAGCQLWSVPEEAELAVSRLAFAFLQNFLQNGRGLTPRRDFRLATGNTPHVKDTTGLGDPNSLKLVSIS